MASTVERRIDTPFTTCTLPAASAVYPMVDATQAAPSSAAVNNPSTCSTPSSWLQGPSLVAVDLGAQSPSESGKLQKLRLTLDHATAGGVMSSSFVLRPTLAPSSVLAPIAPWLGVGTVTVFELSMLSLPLRGATRWSAELQPLPTCFTLYLIDENETIGQTHLSPEKQVSGTFANGLRGISLIARCDDGMKLSWLRHSRPESPQPTQLSSQLARQDSNTQLARQTAQKKARGSSPDLGSNQMASSPLIRNASPQPGVPQTNIQLRMHAYMQPRMHSVSPLATDSAQLLLEGQHSLINGMGSADEQGAQPFAQGRSSASSAGTYPKGSKGARNRKSGAKGMSASAPASFGARSAHQMLLPNGANSPATLTSLSNSATTQAMGTPPAKRLCIAPADAYYHQQQQRQRQHQHQHQQQYQHQHQHQQQQQHQQQHQHQQPDAIQPLRQQSQPPPSAIQRQKLKPQQPQSAQQLPPRPEPPALKSRTGISMFAPESVQAQRHKAVLARLSRYPVLIAEDPTRPIRPFTASAGISTDLARSASSGAKRPLGANSQAVFGAKRPGGARHSPLIKGLQAGASISRSCDTILSHSFSRAPTLSSLGSSCGQTSSSERGGSTSPRAGSETQGSETQGSEPDDDAHYDDGTVADDNNNAHRNNAHNNNACKNAHNNADNNVDNELDTDAETDADTETGADCTNGAEANESEELIHVIAQAQNDDLDELMEIVQELANEHLTDEDMINW